MIKLFHDFETKCELDLKQVGLDLYSRHPSADVLMCSYAFDDGPVQLWDKTEQPKMPSDLADALHDEDVELHAFNAQFERVMMNRVLGITPNIRRWRCTMVHAYMLSFTGDLSDVGHQIGIDQDKQKLAEGKRLIQLFTKPQRVTKNQPLRWRDSLSDPDDWERFKEYCVMDTIAEREIDTFLDQPQFPILKREWAFYALDQIINDRGLPIDRQFCENALQMANRRKAELMKQMNAITGLQNSNSGAQLIPWLADRGYPFEDLQKGTVKKVLDADKARQDGDKIAKGELVCSLTDDCRDILKLRQKAARTTTSKYAALLKAMGPDDRMRYVFQFAGASRTNRFAGRRFQPQNLTSLHELADHPEVLEVLNDAIREADDEFLALLMAEPLDALAGLVRSAVHAKEGKILTVCDLSSIESVTIGWVAKCKRLLDVFRNGLDAYKDFATELYKIAYEAVTKKQRKMAKPATLGAGYRLGGGELRDGKKTGLWGYAEGMGVDMTRKEAHDNVRTFRAVYPEIPQTWYALEDAIKRCIREKKPTTAAKCKFRMVQSRRINKTWFLLCELPSGRCIYYHRPKIVKRPFEWTDSKTGEKKRTIKDAIIYMGKQQNGKKWVKIESHGGKFIENIVQAIARDILREGIIKAHNAGYYIVGHVHDEIISEENEDSGKDLEGLRACMVDKIKWCADMPLNAAGWTGNFYRKD